jgi:DNA-binding transcriptional LysR family regulator
VTPTQLRAFACVRWGSVKGAAGELGVTEAAVSMHVAQLRKELDDDLFTRTSSGLAFTPGGLRLASRAVEILGLQDRTVQEVSQAGHVRRVLRVRAGRWRCRRWWLVRARTVREPAWGDLPVALVTRLSPPSGVPSTAPKRTVR